MATVQIRGSVAQAWDGVEPQGLGTDGKRWMRLWEMDARFLTWPSGECFSPRWLVVGEVVGRESAWAISGRSLVCHGVRESEETSRQEMKTQGQPPKGVG